MKYLKLTVLVLIVSTNFLFTQQKISVTINVNARTLSDSGVVFITGNHELFGNWQPDKISLNKLNYSDWTLTSEFVVGTNLEFKFTLGDWEREALNDDESTPGNNKLFVTTDTVLNFTISRWSKPGTRKAHGQITGTVEYQKQFKSNFVKPRDIIVLLPDNYYFTEKHYPVLYMHDGQNIFDPSTSSFGYDWRVDETTDSLIREKYIEPIIIVGIYNTAQRSSEYSPNDTGKAYMKFIVEELKPFIDERYRTIPDRKNTAIAGSSMGGLISFMLLWEYPDIFSKAACLSPAFKIGRFDYVSRVVNTAIIPDDILIYIDNGGIELEALLQPGIDEMINILEVKGFVLEKNFFWKKFENAYHNEQAWAERFYIPLKLFFGKEKID